METRGASTNARIDTLELVQDRSHVSHVDRVGPQYTKPTNKKQLVLKWRHQL